MCGLLNHFMDFIWDGISLFPKIVQHGYYLYPAGLPSMGQCCPDAPNRPFGPPALKSIWKFILISRIFIVTAGEIKLNITSVPIHNFA